MNSELTLAESNETDLKPRLTIAIPTFDRPARLRQTLVRIIPQLTIECELLLLDNASPAPVEATLNDLLTPRSGRQIRVVRHAYNIGGAANVLRAFELAAGDWIWVLGDDDEPELDAVARVLGDIQTHADAVFLNYSSELCGPASRASGFPKRLAGLEGLATGCDSFSNLLFISSGVFNRSIVHGALRHAQLFMGSFAPHLALLMVHLRQHGGVSVLLPQHLVKHCLPVPTDHWDGHHVAPRVAEVLSLLPEFKIRSQLGKLLLPKERKPYPMRGLLLLAATGRQADLAAILNDATVYEREHALARGVPGIRSLLRLAVGTLVFRLCGVLRVVLGPWLRFRKPPPPVHDLVARMLKDHRT